MISDHGSAGYAVQSTVTLLHDASGNWWGDPSGPQHWLNPSGTGEWIDDPMGRDAAIETSDPLRILTGGGLSVGLAHTDRVRFAGLPD